MKTSIVSSIPSTKGLSGRTSFQLRATKNVAICRAQTTLSLCSPATQPSGGQDGLRHFGRASWRAMLLVPCLTLAVAGCAKKHFTSWESIKNPEVSAQLKSFVAEKEMQANAAIKANGEKLPPEFKSFFTAAEQGDWLAASNVFADLQSRASQSEHSGKTDEQLRGTPWQAIVETWGAFDALGEGDEKYSAAYANDIISSIPPGSIYFGGTDPGRFLITAMQKNQVAGDPFFTLTQNWLANSSYLDYLRSMYSGRIYTPTADDLQRCSQAYTNAAARRLQEHQLKPGEHVSLDTSGRVEISGYVATIEIRARMAKVIFDKNTNREFYIEESFPFDWMYPYLEPHGLIFKLNRQPLAELSDKVVRRDQDYWTKTIQPMIGSWLNPDTTVKEVAAFAEKVFGRHDFSRFSGDPDFVQNAYSQHMFSKERSSIAGLYAWRVEHAQDAADKERMSAAADFAFRQAFALCPDSPETVFRYVKFLMEQKRATDALLIAETAAKMPGMQGSKGQQLRNLISQLERHQSRN